MKKGTIIFLTIFGVFFLTRGQNCYGCDPSFGNSPENSTIYGLGNQEWVKIWGPVSNVILGYDQGNQKTYIYATEHRSGDIYQYTGNWQKIGGPGAKFVSDSSGHLFGLSSDKGGIYEYTGRPGKWIKIGGTAGCIYAGGDKLFATNPDTGNIYEYNRKNRKWSEIGGPGKMFAVDNSGHLFGLSTNKTGVYKYTGTPGKWTKVGGAAGRIFAGGDKLYTTNPDTGNIYEYKSKNRKWIKVGGPGRDFVVGYTGHLYGISPDGNGVHLYSGTPGKWIKVGGAAGRIFAGYAKLYALNPTTHELYAGSMPVLKAVEKNPSPPNSLPEKKKDEIYEKLKIPWNFIIIVIDDNMKQSVSKFASWKKTIGHKIKVVKISEILLDNQGIDQAEKIRNFLKKERKISNSLRYVLLVGDTDKIPTRLFYSDKRAKYNAYAADFYYANLSTSNWDIDQDDKWGEFEDDKFNWQYDIVVSRIPTNSAADAEKICKNIINFEKETGSRKKKELMLNAFLDSNTDTAVLAQKTETDILQPRGWSAKKFYVQYEKTTSKYLGQPNTVVLDPKNYLKELGTFQPSLISITGHGSPTGMSSGFQNNAGKWAQFGFHPWNEIKPQALSAIVYLNGCSTSPPIGDDTGLDKQKSLWSTVNKGTLLHLGKHYLQAGAVAVIGASAGGDYESNWIYPDDGGVQSLNYYFHDHLISRGKRVGDAFFDALLQFTDKFGPQRGIRVFYLMGDPSLDMKGVSIPTHEAVLAPQIIQTAPQAAKAFTSWNDAIIEYRFVSQNDRQVTFEIDYRVDPVHTGSVTAGGLLYDAAGQAFNGFLETHVPKGEGTIKLVLFLEAQKTSEEVVFFFYNKNPDVPFFNVRFPFKRKFISQE